jgi:hypothetical protein
MTPDFFLAPDAPDETDPDQPARRHPVRLVGTGLADTAPVPASARCGAAPLPVFGPCEACGAQVVLGTTGQGLRLALDLQVRTYTISWHHEEQPVLHESRGYPVHHCGGGG